MNASTLGREVKVLRWCTLILTGLCAAALVGVARTQNASFDTITVHRINVVENDGTRRLVISDRSLFPAPVLSGKSLTRDNSDQAGIIFYNDRGDESGGLAFKGNVIDGSPHAQSMMSFDDFESNEAVQVVYNRNGSRRSEGLIVTQQANAPHTTFDPQIAAAFRLPKGSAARAQALSELQTEGAFGWMRMFTGLTEDGSSVLYLADGKGRPRLGFNVTASGDAKIEFLDENGKVVREVDATK